MIFQHTWEQVLDGSKTQTRRLALMQDTFDCSHYLNLLVGSPADGYGTFAYGVDTVRRAGRTVFYRGQSRAVQPGRGKGAVGRILITGIWLHRPQDITEDDCWAEGISRGSGQLETELPRFHFMALWDTIHDKRGERWADNPLVWILTFTLED